MNTSQASSGRVDIGGADRACHMDQLIIQIDGIMHDTVQQLERIADLADRLFGKQPVPAKDKESGPVGSPGKLGAINERLEGLRQINTGLRIQVDRISDLG